MPIRLAVLSGLLFFLCFAGCSRGPVSIDHEPSHHLVLANDYIRVYRVEAGPHKSTRLHRHDHDYIWVSIGPADVTNAVQGGTTTKAQLSDGDVRFVPGNFAHVVTNDSDQPFRNYTIALLRPGSVQLQPGEDEHSVNLLNSGAVESLFVKDGVRAFDITLAPGASLSGPHLARPHLLVDVNPDDQHIQWSGHNEGERLTNNSAQKARYVLLEF
jgi:quercetin dioxygenase-like cupin family protein